MSCFGERRSFRSSGGHCASVALATEPFAVSPVGYHHLPVQALMQRRHLLLLLALVVIALALTLSLMRNELAPEQLQREATPESVAPRAADSTVVGDPTSAI